MRQPYLSNRQILATTVLIAAIATVSPLPAQSASSAPQTDRIFDTRGAAHIRDRYLADLDTLHAKFMALAEAIPADKYSWRPTTGVRSVSEVFMHIASEWLYYDPQSVGGKPPADFGVPKDAMAKLETVTAKADVIAQLEKAWAYGRAQVAGADPATLTGPIKPWGLTIDQVAIDFPGDLHEHLGQLIAYARSNGVKPPWSK
jgi:DinB superfamily